MVMMMSYLDKPVYKGQGAAEYGLAVGLVCLVCIVGLSQMGVDISAMFSNTIVRKPPTLNANSNLNSPSVIANTPNGVNPTAPQNSSLNSPFPLANVCLNQTLCINLPDFPNGVVLQKTPETAGGYGELSKQYAQALEDLVKQLQADPKYKDLNLLAVIQLAKSGHDLSENLNTIQETCTKKQRNKKSGQCEYVADTISNTDPVAAQKHFMNAQQQAEAFLEQTDALPENIKMLIQDLSDQILDLHQSSIGKQVDTVKTMASKKVCERREEKGKKLPKRCDASSRIETNITVDLDVDPNVITLDANTVCGSGTTQTQQCSVEPQ